MTQPQDQSRKFRLSEPGTNVIQKDELLTIAEVAAYLRISQRTAWRWCQSGRLPAGKVGHQWRISRRELEKFVRRQGNLAV